MSELERFFAANRTFAGNITPSTATSHDPELVSVCCCDARVPQATLFGSSPGDHFTVANIGNSVRTWSDGGEPIVSGSVLYPVLETDPEAVFVVGHTDCGAVTAAYEWEQSSQAPDRDELRSELELVRRHVADGLELLDLESHDKPATLARLAEFNVDRQVATLVEAVDEVPVVGAVCDLHEQYSDRRGGVHLVNYDDATEANDVPTELATYHNRLTAP